MPLTAITGVLSRYFVVGFFLPAYVSLVSLWRLASSDFVPNWIEQHSEGTQLLILGGVALVAGLALSGLSYHLTGLFEGYPLARISEWRFVGWVSRSAMWLQRRRFDRLCAIRDDRDRPMNERQRAAWSLEQHFPKRRQQLLPTRMGNAIRAFERHSNERWGLDGVTIFPRIEALMSAEERELHVDAKSDLYFLSRRRLGLRRGSTGSLSLPAPTRAPSSARRSPFGASHGAPRNS